MRVKVLSVKQPVVMSNIGRMKDFVSHKYAYTKAFVTKLRAICFGL